MSTSAPVSHTSHYYTIKSNTNNRCIKLGTRIDYGSLGSAAAQSGSLAMVKHIEQFAQSKLQLNLSDIGLGGSIEVLQYFLNQGRVLDSVVLCRSASASGHLDFIKFAIQHGAPVDEVVMDKCVQYDDVDLIRMLHARGCKWVDFLVRNDVVNRVSICRTNSHNIGIYIYPSPLRVTCAPLIRKVLHDIGDGRVQLNGCSCETLTFELI